MANRPAKAGAASAGPDWGLAGRPALAGADAPPPVHHQGNPRAQHAPRLAHDPGTARGPRAAPDPRDRKDDREVDRSGDRQDDRRGDRSGDRRGDRQANTVVAGLTWLPYLIALAVAALGLAIAWDRSRLAVRGTDLVGGALLLAALARLLLPSRYAGPLSSRGKASDVAGFAVFGTAVLVVALMLS
jgi:Protein of unknown function (DUF3017)